MKTFETEKHNIPEGATHYANETEADYFAWVKFIDGKSWRIMPNTEYYNEWKQGELPNTQPIPQTEDEEWINGLPPAGITCEVRFRSDGEWTDWFTKGKFKAGYDSKIWFSHEFGDCVYPAHDIEFRKPETEADKLKRKQAEQMRVDIDQAVRDSSHLGSESVSIWIAECLVNKGYIKEG